MLTLSEIVSVIAVAGANNKEEKKENICIMNSNDDSPTL